MVMIVFVYRQKKTRIAMQGAAPGEEELSEESKAILQEDVSLSVTPMLVAVFVFCMCGMLLLLYFFFSYLGEHSTAIIH